MYPVRGWMERLGRSEEERSGWRRDGEFMLQED